MQSEKTNVNELTLSEKSEWFVNRVFGGQHHCRKFEDNGNHFLVVPKSNYSFATFDGDKLTKIVMMAHRLCLRAELTNHGMQGLKILLHNRKREADLYRRHPDVEDMVVAFPPLQPDKIRRSPWDIATNWSGNGGEFDATAIPSDVKSDEFAKWMQYQYQLAMRKGIELGRDGSEDFS